MPLYQTLCPDCGGTNAFFRKVAERNDLPSCECGGLLQRVITAAAVKCDEIPPFESPVTGKIIRTAAQHREDLRASGCIANEPGLKADIARRRQEKIEERIQTVEKSIDETVAALNSGGYIETTKPLETDHARRE